MSLQFIDTHCHIHSVGEGSEQHTRAKWEAIGLSSEEILTRAYNAGVTRLICVGTDLNDSKKAVAFAAGQQNCYAAVGIHPHEAEAFFKNRAAQKEFAGLTKAPKVIAIGECGLDYFYNHSSPSAQAEVLKFQLDLAKAADLPLIFHVRNAFSDFWEIFNSYNNSLRGVLHSFTDSIENLEIACARGLFIGVNGIATFSKDQKQQAMYKSIPLSNLLLETDAPYLTPTPYRGNINEPKQIVRVAEYLSELKGLKLDELAQATSSNADKLFGI